MQKSRCFLLEGVRKMKKINWKVIAVLTVLCILGGAYTLAFADTSVDQKTTLNGVVLADGLAAVGMQVSEGQVLVKVKTIAGPAPAARANIAGKVTLFWLNRAIISATDKLWCV